MVDPEHLEVCKIKAFDLERYSWLPLLEKSKTMAVLRMGHYSLLKIKFVIRYLILEETLGNPIEWEVKYVGLAR
jgi:hypothetical protein